MRRNIKFTLRGEEAQLALAFQRHAQIELGISDPLEVLVQRIFLDFLHQHVDKPEPANEGRAANDQRDPIATAVEPTGAAAPALADTADSTDQITSGS